MSDAHNDKALNDKALLEQMRNVFSINSRTMEETLSSIDKYMRYVINSMKQDLQIVNNRLEQAIARSERANQALDSCRRSQRWDEEEKRYRPSCDSQIEEERKARQEYERYQRVCNIAKAIIDECNRKIGEYNQEVKTILTGLSKTSNKATEKLNDIIYRVDLYYNTPSNIASSGISEKRAKPNYVNRMQQAEERVKRKNIVNEFRRNEDRVKELLRNSNICPKHGIPLPCKKCRDEADSGPGGFVRSIDIFLNNGNQR